MKHQQQQKLQQQKQQKQRSTTPSVIQAWANAEQAILNAAAAALTNLATGVKALDDMITAFQNSPGTLNAADQKALDDIQAFSNGVVTQANAISTTPPGTPVPVVPLPPTP